MPIKTYRDLNIWNTGIVLVKDIGEFILKYNNSEEMAGYKTPPYQTGFLLSQE